MAAHSSSAASTSRKASFQWLGNMFGSKDKLPAAKASSSSAAPSSGAPAASSGSATKTDVSIHESKHAQLIGPKGATLQQLKDTHQVAIEVPKKGSGSHVVVISGEKTKRQQCLKAMETIMGFPLLADTPLSSAKIEVPAAVHGRLIGKGGANLKNWQAKGCTVVLPASGSGGTSISLFGYAAVLTTVLAEVKELAGASNFKLIESSSEIEEDPAATFEPLPLDGKIVEVLFFPEETVGDEDGPKFKRFLHYLVSASRTLDICVFTITDDRISQALIAAHHRGVAVRIITDDDQAKSLGSDIEEFQRQGMQVRMDNSSFHMHHKFALIDNKVLINGSYNWTRNANLHNNENITILSEPVLLTSFRAEFDRLWKLFPPRK